MPTPRPLARPVAPPPAAPRGGARRTRAAGLVVVALAALAACGSSADEERERQEQETERLAEEAGRAAAGGEGDSARRTGMRISLGEHSGARLASGDDPALGDGDVRVTSTDGMLVLAVIGDTVRTRLGDSAVTQARREMDAEMDTVSGIGGLVARTVKGAVTGGLNAATRFSVRVPVSEVRDLRYENGELHFRAGRGGDRDGDTGARFARGDAERFIAAVRARQARPAGR